MDEREFIAKLEERANEQEKIIERLVLPSFVFGISMWLGRHPWRFIIPFSILLTLLFRLTLGTGYTEKILWLFGGR